MRGRACAHPVTIAFLLRGAVVKTVPQYYWLVTDPALERVQGGPWPMYLLVIPVLLILELAVAVERRIRELVVAARYGRKDPPWWLTEPAALALDPAEPLRSAPEAAVPEATARPRRPGRWLGWGLAVVILVGCLLFIDPAEIAAALRRLSPQELAVLLLLASLDRILVGLRWGVLLRLAGVRLPLARAVRLFYQASFVGVFMPTHLGGDLLRAWWAVREGGAGHPVAASLVMERLLGLLSAANWAVVGAVVLAASRAPEHAGSLALLGALAALTGNGLFALSLSGRAHSLVLRGLGRLGRSGPARLLQHFYAAYALYGREPR